MLLPALLLASLLSGPGPVGPTVKYRFESKNVTAVDLSAMGQGNQNAETSAVVYLAVTMSDTVGGQLAHVLIDSMNFDAGPMAGMLPDSLLKFKPGTFFHLYVVNGKIKGDVIPSSMNLASAQATQGVAMLFPGIGHNRSVRNSWVDTLARDSTINGAKVATKSYTRWSVTGKEGDSLLLDATSTGTMAMNVMGQDVLATTAGTQHLVVPAAGTVREGSSETKMQMGMTMAGNTVQMSVVQTSKLTRLP